MALAQPVKPPRTTDQKEIDRWYRVMTERLSYHTNAGTPAAVVVPRFIGDRCLDITNSDWYVAHGTTNSDWKVTT